MLSLAASSWGSRTELILFGIVALFALLLFVALPALIFLIAMWEKHCERRLTPVTSAEQKIPGKLRAIIAEAKARGFTSLGGFSDGDKGIKEEIVHLLLSPDRTVLLKAIDMKLSSRYMLVSRLEGDRWLITSDMFATQDQSGRHDEAMLPKATMAAISLYHTQRLAALRDRAIPFPEEGLIEYLYEHGVSRYHIMEAVKLVKPVRGRQDTWVYTAKGAMRIALAQIRNMTAVGKANELAKAKMAEADFLDRGRNITPNHSAAEDPGSAEDAIPT